ncbi:MAG: hypothetical protein QOF89_2723 [Acidobacteriota bacterium]|jgi:hypothetical protein|nr:hypothetical protein [Acidobacteriota bacterium]
MGSRRGRDPREPKQSRQEAIWGRGWTRTAGTERSGAGGCLRGDTGTAERLFLETRDGFVRQGIGYDAAMVSLDLARVYLKEGRTADVQRLAGEMVAIFEAQEVHREATAALLLFQDAARREEVTAGLVRELALYLEAVRADPGLQA